MNSCETNRYLQARIAVQLTLTKGSKYTGRFSDDGKILDGGWRADGAEVSPANTYDATMHKID